MRHGATMPDDLPTQPKRPEKPNEKAAAAFADFVALGDDRSLAKLADLYRNRTDPVPTKQLSRLKIWSSKYKWIERIEQFEDEQAEAQLRESARLDADTFLATSRIANERIKWTTPHNIDVVLKIRESVRKPAPKGGASVSVNVSVEVRHMAERMAEELGLDAEQLIRDAEDIAAREWSKA